MKANRLLFDAYFYGLLLRYFYVLIHRSFSNRNWNASIDHVHALMIVAYDTIEWWNIDTRKSNVEWGKVAIELGGTIWNEAAFSDLLITLPLPLFIPMASIWTVVHFQVHLTQLIGFLDFYRKFSLLSIPLIQIPTHALTHFPFRFWFSVSYHLALSQLCTRLHYVWLKEWQPQRARKNSLAENIFTLEEYVIRLWVMYTAPLLSSKQVWFP